MMERTHLLRSQLCKPKPRARCSGYITDPKEVFHTWGATVFCSVSQGSPSVLNLFSTVILTDELPSSGTTHRMSKTYNGSSHCLWTRTVPTAAHRQKSLGTSKGTAGWDALLSLHCPYVFTMIFTSTKSTKSFHSSPVLCKRTQSSSLQGSCDDCKG